jgi:hypothetical protein
MPLGESREARYRRLVEERYARWHKHVQLCREQGLNPFLDYPEDQPPAIEWTRCDGEVPQ